MTSPQADPTRNEMEMSHESENEERISRVREESPAKFVIRIFKASKMMFYLLVCFWRFQSGCVLDVVPLCRLDENRIWRCFSNRRVVDFVLDSSCFS